MFRHQIRQTILWLMTKNPPLIKRQNIIQVCLLRIVSNASVQLLDVFANEPDDVREIGSGGPISDKS